MHAEPPHFVLFSEAHLEAGDGRWRFVLRPVGGEACLAIADAEPGIRTSRLELLAVVRGLEALDRPSRVTLLTKSHYVSRGISRGLAQWRERGWRWERFGQLVPIRDHDLWQRVDRAMAFHQVECCGWDIDDAVNASEVESSYLTPAAEAASPALLIVPKSTARRSELRRSAFWPLAEAVLRLRRGLSAGLAAMRQPAFTRAA